ncbi:MAG: flavodoxin family protein [Neisseria sp.]|nr:flavodoxin family protein [Neisseria sp.]
MTTVAIVYHSGKGHTKHQAEYVKKGVESVAGTNVLFLEVEEAAARLDDLDKADAIVFGCPTYMGNVSAGMKAFQEAAVSRWFSRAWQDKIAGAFTNSACLGGDKDTTIIGLMVNAMQQGMIYVSLGLAPQPNEPEAFGRIEGPSPNAVNRLDGTAGALASSMMVEPENMAKGDLETARLYGERIATITARFMRGKS